MHSALANHRRSGAGRAIVVTLALSALLHAWLLSSHLGDNHRPTGNAWNAPLTLRIVMAPQPAPATTVSSTQTSPGQHAVPAAQHRVADKPERAPKRTRSVQAIPVSSRPSAQPDVPRAATSPDHRVSLSNLLAQAGTIGANHGDDNVDSRQAARRLVYGSTARGALWSQYMEDWVRKMERIGALNYPEAVRSQGLYGGPTLSVVINADGSLVTVHLARSSGNPTLDSAAINLVRASAPFSAFPPPLAQQARSLEIRRKWTFGADNDLSVH